MAVVGIDLGTTNTVIAAVRGGRATALKDKLGRALLPSVVSFTTKGTPKVGVEAKNRRTIDPENTIFSIKRLIGRTFDAEHVQKAIERLPFEIKQGPGKSTLVAAQGKDYTLPEISAFVLQQAQTIAEARLGGDVADAVITVPANFNDLQRAATKVAGRTAGLEVLRIINEPTAAALAYGFGKKGRERIAVYDFGGGTFDVTLLDLSENVFEVLATAGDTFLGGDDVDRAIMDRMAEELLKKQKVDASSDNLVREQLRAAAEKLKIDLSTRSMAKAKVEDLDFEFTMRRSEFEKLAEPLLKRTLDVCQEAMEVAGMSKKDLDQILLVGGSTRIPLVRRRISSFFGKMPQSRINPDEVVAIGAAIQASSLEAKQGQSHLPAAPRPRAQASTSPSRAPAPLGRTSGTTQTGLAGLKKTLSGTGSQGAGTTEGSVLSGIKSVPPSVNPPGGKLGPAKTLSGVGPGTRTSSPPMKLGGVKKTDTLSGAGRARMGTLAGVGGDDQKPRANTLSGLSEPRKGSTNLGLGAHPSSPPPTATKSSPPPRPAPAASEIGFDDVTKIHEPQREKLETIPGVAEPPEDGSVTFDLETLEAMEEAVDSQSETIENEFSSLDEETTQMVDADLVAANAAVLDSSAEELDLPAPVSHLQPEELGDSALMSAEDLGLDSVRDHAPHDEADLPAPVSQATELGQSALLELDEDSLEDEVDLPAPAVGLPAPKADALGATAVGLPAPRIGQGQAELPQKRDAAFAKTAVGLPSPLAEKGETDLPLVGGATLPGGSPAPNFASPGTDTLPGGGAAEHAPQKPAAALGGTPLAGKVSDSMGFEAASGRAPAPSVDDLDELSVATLLPTEESVAIQASDLEEDSLNLLGGSSPDLGTSAPRGIEGIESAPDFRQALESHSGDELSGASPIEASLSGAPPAHSEPIAPRPVAPGVPLLLDVTPLSLGVEVVGGYVDRLIERNSPVPCEQTRTFATAQDNQAMVRVRVSQGEEDQFTKNTVLGEVELTGISQGPRGSVKVDVSFSLDESGMLQVSATDKETGHAANARLMLAGVAK